MALTVMPQAPTLSGVYSVRDFVPQLNKMTEDNTKALQNAFNFAMDLQNESVRGEQKDLVNKENDRRKSIEENIRNDEVLLAKLQKELQMLKNGEDVQVRSGIQTMQQNSVPEVQKKVDMLNNIDNNTMKWNWANLAKFGGAE